MVPPPSRRNPLPLALLGVVALLSACAAEVPLPKVARSIPEPTTTMPTPTAPLARGHPELAGTTVDGLPVLVLKAGGTEDHDLPVTRELAAAHAAFRRGDAEATFAAIDAGEGMASDPRPRWQLAVLRHDVLQMLGRAAEAEEQTVRVAELERVVVGHDLAARAMRGLDRMEIGDLDAALRDFGTVVTAIGSWSLPVSYGGPPTNLLSLTVTAEAQLRAYTGIATTFALKKDWPAARLWAEATEGLYNDLYYVLGHPLYGRGDVSMLAAGGRAYNLAILGAARRIDGDEARGLAAIADAERYFTRIHHHHGVLVARAMRVLSALALGRLEEARDGAAEAEALATGLGLPDMAWRFAAERGRVLLANGLKAEAEAAFRVAQEGLDAAVGLLGTDSARLRLAAGREGLTPVLAALDLEKGDHAALFRDLERGRARAFVHMLGGNPLATGREGALVQAVRTVDLSLGRQRLANAAGVGGSDGRRRMDDLLAERATRLDELRRRDPEMADVLSVRTIELGDVQARLRPGEVVAYVLPLADESPIRLLLIAREGTRILPLGLRPPDLRALLAEFRNAVSNRDTDRQARIVASIDRGMKLADWGARLAAYVVPSGEMHFVPWGALSVTVPVAVLPSGGWLARSPTAFRPQETAVVVGDPDFGGMAEQLPGAREEAAAVGRTYASAVLVGAEATEEAVRRNLGTGANVLHLATHGLFNSKAPLRSAILLSDGRRGTLITAARLFEAPLPARLVVLSACETGVGQAVAGDDFLGLTRSLYLGGTLAVVSSLWPVEDEGTRQFMDVFHAKARSGDYGGAWLAARDHLKAAGFPPSVHGAFTLGGSVRG